MSYFILTRDIEPKVVGVTHGTGQLMRGKDFLMLNPWMNKISNLEREKINEKAKYEFYAPEPTLGIILEKKAKLTDFIGTNDTAGFYVNDRLRLLIESGCLPNHKFLSTNFVSGKTGEIIEGYWQFVYDLETGENTVDFRKTEYDLHYHQHYFGSDFTVNIQNYQDYINVFYETGIALKTKKLVFNSNFNKNLDFFGNQFLSNKSAYISDRMLKKWHQNQINGFTAIAIENANGKGSLMGEKPCELIFT